MPYQSFPGTEDSETIDIDVRAHRRVIRRKRYRPGCQCPGNSGIITAPRPPKLISKGRYGIWVWTQVLLDKFLFFRPSHRLVADLATRGIELPPGTLAGGLQRIGPMLELIYQAIGQHCQAAAHWHADETGWKVFVKVEEKPDHKRTLWVYRSCEAIFFAIALTKGAKEAEAFFGPHAEGILNADRAKNYWGSGATWAGELAERCFSLFATLLLAGINVRTWLTAFLTACAEAGGVAPVWAAQLLPWNLSPSDRQAFQQPLQGNVLPGEVRSCLDALAEQAAEPTSAEVPVAQVPPVAKPPPSPFAKGTRRRRTPVFPLKYSGRQFSKEQLEQVRALIAASPDSSRTAISRQVCQLLDWRKADGGWKEVSCRVALLATEPPIGLTSDKPKAEEKRTVIAASACPENKSTCIPSAKTAENGSPTKSHGNGISEYLRRCDSLPYGT